MNFALTHITPKGDHRGSLIALQSGDEVPFEIKRVYYIYATQAQEARGFHAHRNLQQMAICVAGSCLFVLDDGKVRNEIRLDSPNKALHIKSGVWREMHDFSADCVLLVLASELYDEADYIRDYKEFKESHAKNNA